MPTKKKIPPDLEPAILARAGKGDGGDAIAAWLRRAHDIEVSGRAVRTYLEQRRKDREPIARAVVVEQVSKTVTSDLQALEDLARIAGEIREKALAGVPMKIVLGPEGDEQKVPGVAPNLNVAVKAVNAERAVREARLRLAGAGGGDVLPPGTLIPATAVVLLPPERPVESDE